MKSLICVIFLIFSMPSLSCTFPHYGEKYNKLIDIEKLDSSSEYYLELPESVNSSKKPLVEIIKYTKESYDLLMNGSVKKKFDKGITVTNSEYEAFDNATEPLSIRKLKLHSINGKMSKRFKIDISKDTIHIIGVNWPVECCICPTQAESKPLEGL